MLPYNWLWPWVFLDTAVLGSMSRVICRGYMSLVLLLIVTLTHERGPSLDTQEKSHYHSAGCFPVRVAGCMAIRQEGGLVKAGCTQSSDCELPAC
jgi:hypothetical protein